MECGRNSLDGRNDARMDKLEALYGENGGLDGWNEAWMDGKKPVWINRGPGWVECKPGWLEPSMDG